MGFRPLYATIRLVIGSLVLAIGLRSWLVMGLIEPVTVAGSSMAPTLRGAFVSAECSDCRHGFSVGAEFAASAPAVTCPQCGREGVSLASLPWQPGDRLWIDRATFAWRAPKRWEVVVARNPEDAAQLCVKRVVGLPGEAISLLGGNVLVDGTPLIKSPVEQHLLRQVVHRENLNSRRWQPTVETDWRWEGHVWQHDASRRVARQADAGRHSNARGNAIDWLRYQQPLARPLTDDVTFNAGLTRQLNLVDEFMLTTELSVQGEGTLALTLSDGTTTAQVDLQLPDGHITLWEMTFLEGQRPCLTARLSAASRQQLALGRVLVELSNFDQQLLLMIDGQCELRHPWPNAKAVGTDRPVSIGAVGIDLRLGSLTLYRDIYHCTQAVNSPSIPAALWQLGPEEYFLLGDNSPISIDSRRWGPVPGRLVVGKLLGSR